MATINSKDCYEELKKESKISLKNIKSEKTFRYLVSRRKFASLEGKEFILIITDFENNTQLLKINKVSFKSFQSGLPIDLCSCRHQE